MVRKGERIHRPPPCLIMQASILLMFQNAISVIWFAPHTEPPSETRTTPSIGSSGSPKGLSVAYGRPLSILFRGIRSRRSFVQSAIARFTGQGFQDRRFQSLTHPSKSSFVAELRAKFVVDGADLRWMVVRSGRADCKGFSSFPIRHEAARESQSGSFLTRNRRVTNEWRLSG
jgi:hypothetical protein